MTVKVCFFHRNKFHNQLYPRLARYFRSSVHLETCHIKRIGGIPDEEVFEYEIEIEKLWDDIDISIESLDALRQRYPEADLVRSIYAERNLNYFPAYTGQKRVSYDRQLKYLVGCFIVFERFVKTNHMDCVVSDLDTGIPDVFRFVCNRNKVTYITIRSSKITPGFIMCDGENDHPLGLHETYSQFASKGIPEGLREKAREHLASLRNKIVIPDYMEVTKTRYRLLTLARFRSFVKKLKQEPRRTSVVSMNMHPIRTSLLWNLIKFINIWQVRFNKNKWFTARIPTAEQYFVFTLQYEPENSTAIRAFPFSNQLCVIENIAKALPLGILLYVKEHQGNQGYRKSEDYRKISYLPNVRLVGREASVHELLSGAIGVITLTSRMGWEALALGKHVISLGRTFYTEFDGVLKPSSWEELRGMIQRCVDEANDVESPGTPYDEKMQAYTAAYIKHVHTGKYVFNAKGMLDQENIKKIAGAILERIGITHE